MTDASCVAAQLRVWEEAAWQSQTQCTLYRTPLIPGFPWYTVLCNTATLSSSSSDSVASEVPGVVARRYVIPYDFTFRVFVKGRWVGRRLLDVYSEELPHHSVTYYQACLAHGRLRCVRKQELQKRYARHNVVRRQVKHVTSNSEVEQQYQTEREATRECSSTSQATDCKEDGNVILQHGDIVLHTVHRHEIPIAMGLFGVSPIELRAVCIRSLGLLYVEKPAGICTHATGRYYYNSLLGMLEYVLAPRRLAAWLFDEDPLLQSLVSTTSLSTHEKQELYDYYKTSSPTTLGSTHNDTDSTSEDDMVVSLAKAPRPCYRLDRAVSGVLLLGVSQSATRAVSAALMRKSTRIDDVLRAQSVDEKTHESMRELRETVVQALQGPTFDVCKRYLARVQGIVHRKAQEMQRDTLVVLPVSSSALRHLNEVGQVTSQCLSSKEVNNEALLVVTLAGTSQTKASKDPKNAEENDDDECATQSAATLVQPLENNTHRTTSSSLVLCTPLTGRLHQIRSHLSQLGHPIVGDIQYSTQSATSTAYNGDTCVNATTNSSSVNNDGCVYFDAADLPQQYRQDYYTSCMAWPVHDQSLITSNKYDKGKEWASEPLCYECARRLPIATLSENTGGHSANVVVSSHICLHAWEYVVRRALFDHTNETKDSMQSVNHLPQSQYVMSTPGEDGYIVFRAPAPAWAEL